MITKDFGNGYTITTSGENFIEAFEQMAALQDVFESCPLEGSNGDFKLVVRDVTKDGEDYRYYELWDKRTKAKKPLHVYKQKDKKGLMYVAKKDKKGNWLPNDGWTVFKKEDSAPATDEVKTNKATASAGKKSKISDPDF